MLDAFIYENHLGQRFVGLDNGTYLNYNDLRDYAWSYEAINNRISRFYRSITDRKLPLFVHCNTESEAIAIKNRLFELAEIDIEAKLPGKIYIGEYYTRGYITASSKKNYLMHDKMCQIDLRLTSDDAAWYKEHLYSFPATTDGLTGTINTGYGTDYPYDYSYDYSLRTSGRRIVCDSVGSNEFRLLIYGPITDPCVVINDHRYTVSGTINNGETLLIDSLTKTIVLTTESGYKINWFDARSRDSYVFEPIPAGQNVVTYNGSFGFDLTIIEKRSEPRWT